MTDKQLHQRVLDGVLDMVILSKNNVSGKVIYDQIRYIQKLQFKERIRDFEKTAKFHFKNQMKKFFTTHTHLGMLLWYYTTTRSIHEWTMWHENWEFFRNVVYEIISNDVCTLIRRMIKENIEKAYSSRSRKKGFLNRKLEESFRYGLSHKFDICVDLYNARVRVISHGTPLDFGREQLFEIDPNCLNKLNLMYYRNNCKFLQK